MSDKVINSNLIEKAMSYEAYYTLSEKLLAEGKTTGDNHSESMVNYTKLNVQRMHRLSKKTEILPEIKTAIENIDQAQTWLVLTEAWCGDAAQIIPVLDKMQALNPLVQLKLILRDEHLEVMDQFLTNGGRSIPKIAVLATDTLEVKSSWGPRPNEVQHFVMETKEKVMATDDEAEKKEIFKKAKTEVQKWYNKDKTHSIQKEFLAILPK